MAVGFIWAIRRCNRLDTEIVRDFRVDLLFAAIGALGGEVSFGGELSLFHFLPFSVVDDRRVFAGTKKYMPLTTFPARVQENGEVIEHFPF